MEMEALFTETVEKLMKRVNMLEATAKENRETREITQIGEKIERNRQSSMDPASLRLLEQMESNARNNPLGLALSSQTVGTAGIPPGGTVGTLPGGGGARLAPGRPRVANPRQAF